LKTETAPTLADIREARARLAGVARVTPIHGSRTFAQLSGRETFLKVETLQRTGAFKVRGAYNKIVGLDADARAAGVVAASAGNHGQAVAWAAHEVGTQATIFMPEDAPMTKVEATRSYGARIEFRSGPFEDSLAAALAHAEESGATFVHPFEDPVVIAGQGTLGLELVEQLPDVDTIVVPIGGGGLAAGIGLAVKALRPEVHLTGVQAAGTLPGGPGFTIADGIAVKRPGELTMSILAGVLDEIVIVTDEEISEAIVLLLERTKLVVEGAGAVGIAALLHDRVGGRGSVGIVLSGGNIDAALLISVMRRGLTLAGRYLNLRTRIPDRPGELAKLVNLLAAERVNIVEIEHIREAHDVPIGETGVTLTVLTRDPEHCDHLVATMREWGYAVDRLA
jgi:threonine dehydratase